MKFGYLVGVALYIYLGLLASPLPTQAQTTVNGMSVALPASDSYTPLKPGDSVQITVLGFPDLSGQQMISTGGTVSLPMVGSLEVVGLSTDAAAQRISSALLPYVRRPQVNLTLVTPSPLRISITGEVLNPGPRSVPLENANNNSLRLSEILVAAGGITPSADLQNIVIRRSFPRRLSTANPSIMDVDLWEAIQTGDLEADPIIYDGDEIIVPTAQARNSEQATLLNSTIAPTNISVSVAGEVQRPGQLQVSPSADITAAIAAAGGVTRNANTGSIRLFRISSTGQLQRETFSLGEGSTTLMNGDVIVVGRSTTSDILNFLGDIVGPAGLLLRIFN